MTWDDKTLRDAFQSLSVDAIGSDACPSSARIWDAVHGALTPTEVEGLLAHVATCGACTEAWRVARDFGDEAKHVRARIPQWWYAMAAALVLAIGVSIVSISRPPAAPSGQAPIAQIPQTFLVPVVKAPIAVSSRYALTWRGPGDGKKFLQELSDALEPYRRDDFRAAAALLAPMVKAYPDAAEPAYYLGVSLLMLDDPAGAAEPLTLGRDRAEPGARDDAQWYLAAALERSERGAAARAILQGLCNGTGVRSAAACAAIARQ